MTTTPPAADPVPVDRPVLVDTGVWTWVRDRRFPHLARWFNELASSGRVLVCDLVVLELIRLTPNAARAREVAERLDAFDCLPVPNNAWRETRATQLLLAEDGNAHRRVPPIDLLLAATARAAGVSLLHYDRDYERIGRFTDLQQQWFVPDGSLAEQR